LERWLKHEPIRARRTGIITRGKKWLQRNPTVAAVMTLSLALAAALGVIVWKSEPIRHPVTNGVAVLPFENLSGDPDNAYFASGIQDEILTRLASIADLRLISRTSTQQYQSKPRNLREIAKQLGVAHVVEGSVQKAADQVRVNVQLLNAQTDSHLWAHTYDRKLTDIFAVESEVAKAIAEALQAKLTGGEQRALAVKPTTNAEAYDAYLRDWLLKRALRPLQTIERRPCAFTNGRCSSTQLSRWLGPDSLVHTLWRILKVWIALPLAVTRRSRP
jgi:TolB-like protein